MRPLRQVEIINHSRGTVLGTSISVADSAMSRLVGLLGKSRLGPGTGLLINPSSGVHTFGMRFPIDVVALDRGLRVRGVWEAVRPWRIAALSLQTCMVLELPTGVIRASRTQIADDLEVASKVPL